MMRRKNMPKRGNLPKQESGFGQQKDIRDKPSVKLDRANEGGMTQAVAPIVSVYEKAKMRRGGAGLWRRKHARKGRRRVMAFEGGEKLMRRKISRRKDRIPKTGSYTDKWSRGMQGELGGILGWNEPMERIKPKLGESLSYRGAYRRKRHRRRGRNAVKSFAQGAQYAQQPTAITASIGTY
jgi:hypothetical protein